jgi:hypothetical protein
MMVLVVPSSTLFKLLLLLSLFMLLLLLLFNRRRATSSLVIFEVLKFSKTSRTCSSLSIFTSSFLPPLFILLLISDAMLLVYKKQKTLGVFCLLFTTSTTATTNLLRAHGYTHKLTRARDSFSFSFSFSCQTDFVVTVRFPNTQQVRYFCLFLSFVRNARLFFNQFFSRLLHKIFISFICIRESL